MIFPELGPQYAGEAHKDVLARMEAFYAESVTINQAFWQEADLDTRFENGDQTVYNELYGNLAPNRRRQFCFNRIRPIINMISGYQRKNRKSTIVSPIENGDQITADQMTKILMWINKQEGVLETISDAFHGSLVTGMNLLQVWVDYREDPVSGNIKVSNCSYNSFLIDPFFRKPDLSDCNGIWKRSFLTKREVISLLPDHAEEILGLYGNDSGTGRDGKFPFSPESYGYSYKNLLTYDEFYYRDYRKQKMLVDTQTGETMEWKHENDDRLKLYLQTYPQVTVIEQDVPTVKMAIVVQGKVFYHGANVVGTDNYPFVPVFAYYTSSTPYWPNRVQSVVRALRDPQFLYNRFLINIADILESQINSGWVYKEDALVDPRDIFMSGQGKGLALKKEAQMTDVQKIPAAEAGQSIFNLAGIFSEEILKESGVNEELMGSAVDDKSGILSMLRQGAGLTSLQGLFDNLDHAQKLLGKLMLDIIQANFMPGKVQKILEDEQPSPQFYSKAFGKYGCVVEEGLNTSTQKQMNFAQLLQLREVGVVIPDDVLLDASTIQEKTKLVEAVRAQQQAQAQAAQEQQQSQIQEAQARTELAQARAVADQGLGRERMSRIQENQALAEERRAAAVADQEKGFLDLVKALKELEDMDIAQIERLVALSQIFKNNVEKPNEPVMPQGS